MLSSPLFNMSGQGKLEGREEAKKFPNHVYSGPALSTCLSPAAEAEPAEAH